MAENKSKSNKVPKLSEVIKSTLSNIKEITDATKVIVGFIKDLAKLIPEDFDKNVENIQKNLLKGVESIDKMVKVFTSIDSSIKLDLKSITGMKLKIYVLKQYMYLFMQMIESLSEYIIKNENINSQLDNFKNSAFSCLKEQIDIINNIELSTVTTKMLMARLFVQEFKYLSEYIFNTLRSIEYDENSIENINNTMEKISDLVNNMNAPVLALNEVSIVNLLTNQTKIFLMSMNIQSLLDIQLNLSKKITKKKLDAINERLTIINNITENIFNIFENLNKIDPSEFDPDALKLGVIGITNLVDVLDELNNKLKEKDLSYLQNNSSILLEILDSIYNLEKKIIIVSLLSLPFAIAALAMLIAVSVGMGALLLTIKFIMWISNPALLRLARISMNNLYHTVRHIAYIVSITVLTIMLILLTSSIIIENVGAILLSIAVIGIVIWAFAAMGSIVATASIGVTLFALGMVILGVALISLIGITFILKSIAKINFTDDDKKTIKSNVENIIGAAKEVINIIFGEFDDPMGSNGTKNGDDGLILTLLKWVGGDMLTNVLKIIMASAILFFTVISVGMVLTLGVMLSTLTKSPLEASAVGDNGTIAKSVRDIMQTAKSVINTIFDSFDDPMGNGNVGDDGLIFTIVSVVAGDMFVNMIKLILANVLLASTVMAVGAVWIMGRLLNKINNITIGEGDNSPSKKAEDIMTAAKGVIAAVNSPNEKLKEADKSIGRSIIEAVLPSSLVNMIDAVMAIGTLGPMVLAVGAVGFMAKMLNEVSKAELANDIETRAETIIKTGSKIISLVNNDSYFKGIDEDDVIERASAIKLVAEAINELGKDVNIETHNKLTENACELIKTFTDKNFKIDNYSKFSNNTIKLIDKIDKSKLENLQTAHNMFKEMKEFSESISGNFDGLAEALNEKIAPLLEELKELIGKIPESVDKSASTISTSMYNTTSIASGTATTSTMRAQVQSENPSMSKEDIGKIVDQRMTQQAQSVNKGIEMRLEELLEILQNYSNPIPVRMS